MDYTDRNNQANTTKLTFARKSATEHTTNCTLDLLHVNEKGGWGFTQSFKCLMPIFMNKANTEMPLCCKQNSHSQNICTSGSCIKISFKETKCSAYD